MRYAILALMLIPFVVAACGDPPLAPETPAPACDACTRPPESPTAPPSSTTIAAASPSPADDSGIEGIVTIGPTCPVERADSPCPDRSFEATIDIQDASGRRVAQVRSGADGRFRVSLEPGAYILHPLSTTTPPYAADQTVSVARAAVTSVQIQYDSGIR